MVVPTTEQKPAGDLESVLKDGQASDQSDKVSEEQVTEEEPKDEKESEEKAEEKAAETKKPEADIEARIQAEADKRANKYRETREADTALIRKLSKEVEELQEKISTGSMSKLLKELKTGYDEEGLPEEGKKAFHERLDEINQKVAEYNKLYKDIKEAANLATLVAEKADKKLIAHFQLNDPNPGVQAKGMLSAMNEVLYYLKEKEANDIFWSATGLLKNDEEVLKKRDEFVEEYKDSSEGKARDRLINQLKQELRIVPRKKAPSGEGFASGGTSFTREQIAKMSTEDFEKNRDKIIEAQMAGKIK